MIDDFLKYDRIEQLFAQRALDRNNFPAVSTANSSCSYTQLQKNSNQVAQLLRAAASKGSSPIGVLLPNSPALPQAVLGVWMSGNVVVPISTNYSSNSIERIITSLGINIIVIDQTDSQRFSKLAGTVVIHNDSDWTLSTGQLDTNRQPLSMTPEHAAVFLTSGTTGNPKIVALTHRNILFNLIGLKKAVPLDETDKSFVCVPLCHSYGFTLQMLGTLCTGGQLYIAKANVISSEFVKELHASQCTSFFGVPTAYRLLLDGINRCGNGCKLHNLQTLVNGASSMTPEILSGLQDTLPWADIHLTYGLSEASPLVTSLPPQWINTKSCSIGKAVAGVELVLQSDNGENTTQAGFVGEILIKGPSVIEGYWGNAEANARSFINEYLRTGDVAMIDADGCLFFKGRSKDLINRGGEKIYPEDIEAVLQSHDLVLHSAVVPCPHQSLGEVPFAFVVFKDGQSCEHSQLRQWCSKHLSPQQVPVGIEIVESLPRTATGKIRKNELALSLARR